MVDRAPDYSKYSRDELYEALNKLDVSTYPDREASIREYLEKREEVFLPEDFTVRKLNSLRRQNIDAGSRKELRALWKRLKSGDKAGVHFKDGELEARLDAELKKRKTDTSYANRGKASWQIGKVNKKLIAAGLVVIVVLGGLISNQPNRISSDESAVQDALFLAQRTTVSQQMIGDSLILGDAITGELNVEEHGPWFKTGTANLTIAVKGDSGSGQLFVEGSLKKNAWNFTRLDLQSSESDSTISLLDELMETAGIEVATNDSLKQ